MSKIFNPADGDHPYCYRYPHAAVTADCVIYGFDGENLKILLIERGLPPYKGMWALPGGFMKIDETIDETARRELFEETGLKNVYLTQFKVFSKVDRDPRERVVTVAFIALVRPADYNLIAGDDAANALWFDEDMLPPMAFDHIDIIREARAHLSETLRVRPVAFELLNKVFSLSELQKVYEAVNRTTYDRRNFQRKALQSGWLSEAPEAVDSASSAECCCSAVSEPEPLADEDDKPMRLRKAGRPAMKLFSFRRKKQHDDDDTDGSIKDLFDF